MPAPWPLHLSLSTPESFHVHMCTAATHGAGAGALADAFAHVTQDKPKLPSFGFDYDADAMQSLLSLPLSDLFAANPGCGSSQLVLQKNKAARYGGGLHQQMCNQGLQQRGSCWIGGIAEGVSSTFTLSFDGNTAGAAGGAVYSTCYSLDVCQSVAEKTIGLPNLSGESVKLFSLLKNTASGFGNDLASAPRSLRITQYAKAYVPGKSALNVTFSLFDSLGQVVMGSGQVPISHMVHLFFFLIPYPSPCCFFNFFLLFSIWNFTLISTHFTHS